MAKHYVYMRVSTDTQTTDNQLVAIYKYAGNNDLKIKDKNIIKVTSSSLSNKKARLIDDLISRLKKGDTIICYDLSRLGRSTLDTLQIIEEIKAKSVKIILVKDNIIIDPFNNNPINNMMLTMLSSFAQLERDFISERTKAGLAARKIAGLTLGRTKGKLSKSIYDDYKDLIQLLLDDKQSLTQILHKLQLPNGKGSKTSLHSFIKSRKLVAANKKVQK